MSTTVKTGWLHDKNGDKFAPKTLTSQVQTSDGVLLEDKIQADLDAAKEDILTNVSIDVDDALSSTSTNPVQNAIVTANLDAKMNTSNPTGTGSFSLNRKSGTTVGSYSFTEGRNTTASGNHGSHAEGSNTTASGSASHAEGNGSTASGGVSHAEGGNATASGQYSHAEGNNTIAKGTCQHVQGKNNIEDTNDIYAHIVGNGASLRQPSNAHTLDWGGNAWYAGTLKLGGTSYDDASEVALKSDIVSIDLSEYETAANAQTKYDNAVTHSDENLETAKTYTDTVASGKANSSHTHDDRYYTESEIDTKLSSKADNTHNHDTAYDAKGSAEGALAESKEYTDTVASGKANTSHTHSVSDVTNLQSSLDAKVPTSRTINGKALSSNITLSAGDIGAATSGHNHDSAYDAKGAADTALASAKSYTDSKTSGMATTTVVDNKISAHNTSTTAHGDIRDLISELSTKVSNFLDVDDTTTDQLSEVLELIENNKGTLESLTSGKVNVSDIVNNLTTASTSKVLSANQGVVIKGLVDALQAEVDGKADEGHGHAIADVSGLQSALDGKAAASHGTHVTYDSTNKPKMDGTAAFGTSSSVARADHIHPTDTSRASQTALDSHTGNTTVHITSTERTNWNAAKTHADSAHAPSNAQANVIESIKVNGTAQTITSKAVNITVPTKASDIGAATASHSHAISDVTNLQTTLNNASSAISANTSSISALTDRTTALENKVGDGFEEITSAEISALFA